MDADPQDLLERFNRLTVVGASATPGKDAHDVPGVMISMGWDVVPVNPRATEIHGRKVYASLADAPQPVGMVNVFRPSEEAADVARQAVAAGASAIWLQLGIRSEEARRIAAEAGIPYVEDRCVKVEAHHLKR